MADDFDVMSRKNRWDRTTRKVLEERVSEVPSQEFFTGDELKKIEKVIEAVVPGAQKSVPVKEMLGREFKESAKSGVRPVDLPWRPDMYKKGLEFLDEEARERFGKNLIDLSAEQATELLDKVSRGDVNKSIWGFPPELFFQAMVKDIVAIYYAFPQSWNEIEFAGPAYPYGYYRLGCNEKMKYEPEVEGESHG